MSLKSVILVGLTLTVVLAGCAAYLAEPVGVESSPLGKGIPTYQAPQEPVVHEAVPAAEPLGTVTLPQVLALALTRNPELAAFSREVRAREAAVLQASLFPNPELNVIGANLGNTVLQDFDGPQATVSLSQLIFLGGKRVADIQVAQLDQVLGGWDYETKRIDVLTRVAQAFVEVLQAQEGLALAEDLLRLAEQVVQAVSARVRAGKVSPVEEMRAQVALAFVRIEQERAARELEAARKRLAATWGSTTPRFTRVLGDLTAVSPLPSLEALAQRIRQNPDLARWATEIAKRAASLDLERRRAIPDLTVSLGVTRFTDTDDHAVLAGLSMPLPLFNRNQGAILGAQQRLAKTLDEEQAAQVRVSTALSSAYQALAAAHVEAMTLRAEALPGAQRAFGAVREGYRLGKFGFLDVLDAQRTLFTAKVQHLRALANYHQAVAEVERLIGEPLQASQKP